MNLDYNKESIKQLSKHKSEKKIDITQKEIIYHISKIIDLLDEPKRRDILKTPIRWSKMIKELTSGNGKDVHKVVKDAIFNIDSNDIVLIKDIDIYSLCEHHIIPFFGKAHIAYIPNNKIIGLSKIPRIVDIFTKRLQIQERLTNQIANAIKNVINPKGVCVIIEAVHLCVIMRGAKKHNSKTITKSVLGIFKEEIYMNEFFKLLSNR